MTKSLLLCASLLLGACSTRNPKFCGDGVCIDPALPFCDIDGTVAGAPGTCISVSCEPNTFEACRGDDTIVCNATGDDFDVKHCDTGCKQGVTSCNPCKPTTVTCGTGEVQTCGTDGVFHTSETCTLGCTMAPAPHCEYLEPKYLPDICDQPASQAELVISSFSSFSTDFDANCNGGIVSQQSAAPAICVMRYGVIEIKQGIQVDVTGGRALALVADSSLKIAGALNLSASHQTGGPGGGVGNAGQGTAGGGQFGGGGGGGFATAGAAGASQSTDGGANNGGAVQPNPNLLPVLIGGSIGAGSAGAGGAATLIACRGKATIDGFVLANGGGGAGGSVILVSAVGGGGGGSGGNVVVQGLKLDLTGELYATGGAGGAGKPTNQAMGRNGEDGHGSMTMVAIGGVPLETEGRGGNGGLGALPTFGKAPTGTGTAGGGGGSVGFLQTYTPANSAPNLTLRGNAPPLQSNLNVKTR